jgi:hypothetical protein
MITSAVLFSESELFSGNSKAKGEIMLNHQTQIVVIGAGYAGLLATVRLAGKMRWKPVAITLVNPTATFIERLHHNAKRILARGYPNRS